MKILFDASVHLGQFHPTDEAIRVASKNSQASISSIGGDENESVITFNENSWVDHVIWGLKRAEQDIFYRFMDVFHTIKQIERVPLTAEDAKFALQLSEKLSLDVSDALSCAVAVRQHTEELHTWQSTLLQPTVIEQFQQTSPLKIPWLSAASELRYAEPELETAYQDVLRLFRDHQLNVFESLRQERKK